jgi:hypothetical protein
MGRQARPRQPIAVEALTMPTHSGENFDQMLRRIEHRRAGAAAEGAMAMPGKPFGKKDDDGGGKGFAPAQKGNLAPPFSKKMRGKRPRKAFTPASRALRGGAR